MRPAQPPQLAPLPATRRPWIGVVSSVLIHGTLLTLVLWSEAHPNFSLRPQADSVELAARRARAVSMVYLPPPAPSPIDGRSRIPKKKPDPAPAPPPPPAPPEERPPAKGDEGAKSAEDNVAADGGASAPSVVPEGLPTPAPPTEPPRRHIPSIAFRGGQPGASEITRTDPSPTWQAPPTLAGATPRCIPGPPRSASDPIEFGVVQGRVYQLGTSLPLVGATLQVLGTPYSTVSDAHGDYVLRFDSWPLRNCQEEYVRVQLDGFVSQTLNLTIGSVARSDVQLRGR